ncbi:phycobilisome rod-core linker polypeptide [Allocoleopsis franciscana]|uniref:Phycobilisome Linker polypeptide/CpcD/allophycocyanin linker domain protein n=1 Tax=Allocoleopsis franciscana PCC 7113 TaxID=1173027 RepID=K9WLK8_9CYAN|nr:phycobilisome rod-core linker polypeptide [Allocoleopsis franciscana]AFZ20427.1 Phycobilisome Linker polypeptide/CpcD/allophycocyanin linker domain protein [Allocoleopsis franciscana PCC 7113]
MALWIEAESVERRSNATEDDLQAIIRAVYRQVLGNAHVLDSQRLTNVESQFRNGDITVRNFVRAVAQSDLYRSRCFETSSPYRFIELNFKHLLGRAPQDQAEIAEHVQIYHQYGYEAEINSYIDSDEYIRSFGEHLVPSARGNRTQSGIKNVSFNRSFTLMRGFAANDVGKSAKLISDIGGNLPTKIVAPSGASGVYSNTGKRFRVAVSQVSYGPRVTQSVTTFEVGYSQLSQKIQNIQKTGGKILRVTEVA